MTDNPVDPTNRKAGREKEKYLKAPVYYLFSAWWISLPATEDVSMGIPLLVHCLAGRHPRGNKLEGLCAPRTAQSRSGWGKILTNSHSSGFRASYF